jgi:hypothetical protein
MLLNDVIAILSSNDGSLTEALLKTKILLHQIGKKELTDWVNDELNGYANKGAVPPYRVVSAQVLANASNGAWRITSHPIPLYHLKPERREDLEVSRMAESLAVLEDLASKDDEGTITRPLPMEANGLLSKGLGNGYVIERAWCELNKFEIKNILVQVRSRLLDFLLELRDSAGDARTDQELKEKATSFDATGLFQNAIFGPNTTIVVGSHNVQSVRNSHLQGDFEALSDALRSVGIPREEVTRLQTAIEDDRAKSGAPSFEGKTGKWFTNLLARAAKGGLNVGVDVVSSAAGKALAAYLGGSP